MNVGTFDPQLYKFVVGGRVIKGFAGGTFISLEAQDDVMATQKGALGDLVNVPSNSRHWEATVTLLPTAEDNTYLSSFVNAILAKQNSAYFNVTMFPVNGDTIFEARRSWVSQYPTVSIGDSESTETREWTIAMAVDFANIGGHVLNFNI